MFYMAVFFYLINGACENESAFHGQKFGGTGLEQGKEWGCSTGKSATGKSNLGSRKGSWIMFLRPVSTLFRISTKIDQNL